LEFVETAFMQQGHDRAMLNACFLCGS